MKCFFTAISIICCILALYLFCSDAPVAGHGGSGTETVGGILVDTLSKPVQGAIVRVASITDTTSNPFYDMTNKEGEYYIEQIKSGLYNLEGYTHDSSLVIFIDSIYYEDDSKGLDLGIDTMHAPGIISGQVLLDSIGKPGVLIYIPGTSYNAYSDDSGYFVMTGVSEGVYNIYYKYPGYITGKDSDINVFSGVVTYLETKNLLSDPDGNPPAPGFLIAEYDTATGMASLLWDKVTVSDLMCYYIYRKGINDSIFIKIGTAYETSYNDTVFANLLDTLSYNYKYQAKSVDTLTNESPFSPAAEIIAASPTLVRTFFNWTLKPEDDDTIVNGQSVKFIVDFTNKTRKNKVIRWYTGDPLDIIEIVSVNVKDGTDTLAYSWQDSGVYLICVEALDEGGCVWRDSCNVSIFDSAEIYDPDTWKDFYPLMNPRRQLGAAVIENTIYAVGGIISINTGDNMELALASVESYTFSDSAWTQSKNLDSARYEYAIVAVLGKLYVFGGSYRVINESKDLKSITMYDPFTNEWNIAGEMPSIRIAPAACVINDSVYIFGGLTRTGSNFNITSSIDVFDPKTGLWSQKGDMLQPRMSHQVVAVNGAVYILGGLAGDFTTVLSSVEIYNPSNNSCSNAPDMSVARKNFGVAVVEGTIYAIGGLSSVVSQEVLTKVEAYNISEGEWVDKKSLPSGRHSFATCVYNRIIYVIGGTERKDLPLGQVGSVIKYYP